MRNYVYCSLNFASLCLCVASAKRFFIFDYRENFFWKLEKRQFHNRVKNLQRASKIVSKEKQL
jgi:hypothetical protein